MTNTTYETATIGEFEVHVFHTYEGDTFHILKDGIDLYNARVNKGQGMTRATEKVAQFAPTSETTLNPLTLDLVQGLASVDNDMVNYCLNIVRNYQNHLAEINTADHEFYTNIKNGLDEQIWLLDEHVKNYLAKKAEEVKSLSAGYDRAKLIEAKTQLIGYFVSFQSEDLGSRWFAAIEKAHDEILENSSILFDGSRLIFTSRKSRKQRIVTRFGCSKECQCGGLVSYHFALWHLLNKYEKLSNNVRSFPVREVQPMRRAA